MCIVVALLAVLALWLGYNFVKGFIQGVRGPQRPRLRVVWGEDEEDDLPRNL
jgi:hypothetical protein